MNVTLKIYFSSEPFNPACYFCDWDAAWQLWFTLIKGMQKGESEPHVLRVEIFDGATKLEPEKGICASFQQQFKIN